MLVLAACAACNKTPVGFSGGQNDRWTLPLVGSLEDGLLITPVTIGTHGPYLFALDPDAPISAVDGDLVKEAELAARPGAPQYDETGLPQQRLYVEMASLEVGSLVIEKRKAIVVRAHTFDAAGRRIHGVLGHDVLDDSLVFGFDRDQGIATLVEPKVWKAPASGVVLPYQTLAKALPVVGRRVVKATIGDEQFDMHLDLGATASQLRDGQWARAKLVARDVSGGVFDEAGTFRKLDKASEPAAVTVGGASSSKVVFVPYGEQRWGEGEVAGALGLGFFAPYDVWLSLQTHSYYLVPRTPVPLAMRIGRWDTGALDKCQNPGCVTLRMVDPLAGKRTEAAPADPPDPTPAPAPAPDGGPAPAPKPAVVKPPPGVILSLTREERAGGMPLEVVLEAKDRPMLPLVIANLPPHVDRLIDQLPAEFAGVTLIVVDASPYPRDCPGKNGCVDKLAR